MTLNGLAGGWMEEYGGWEEQFAGSNSDGGRRSQAADTTNKRGTKHEREQSFLLGKYLDSFHHHDCVTSGEYVLFKYSNIIKLHYNKPI